MADCRARGRRPGIYARKGYGRFIGRFSIETFIVSLASVPAPVVFHNAFPDAALGPVTGRIHTYHLGLWFNSPTGRSEGRRPSCGGFQTTNQ